MAETRKYGGLTLEEIDKLLRKRSAARTKWGHAYASDKMIGALPALIARAREADAVDDSGEQGSARLRDEEHNPDRKRIEGMEEALRRVREWIAGLPIPTEGATRHLGIVDHALLTSSVSLGRGDGVLGDD